MNDHIETPEFRRWLSATVKRHTDRQLSVESRQAATQAYRAGWRAWARPPFWDDALTDYSLTHCEPHPADVVCELEHAWAEGWKARSVSRLRWLPFQRPTPRVVFSSRPVPAREPLGTDAEVSASRGTDVSQRRKAAER